MDKWHQAVEQLNQGNYEQLEQIFQAQQESAQKAGQLALAAFLLAASQICLSCQQLSSERDLLHRALQDINRRENELRKQLINIVEMLLRDESKDQTATDDVIIAPALDDPRAGRELDFEKGETKRFVHLIQKHFDLAPPFYTPSRRDRMVPDSAEEDENQGTPTDYEDEMAVINNHSISEQKGDQTASITFSGDLEETNSPSLTVYCFGQFMTYLDDQLVDPWPSEKGKSIFKYLVTHRERSVAKEILMDLFWPEASASAARNNLNVAIYALRQTLRKVNLDLSYVLFQGGHYQLNPELAIWVDAEEFMKQYKIARDYEKKKDVISAIRSHSIAESLYRGEFFQEDRYEEWIFPIRRDYQTKYLKILTFLSNYYYDHQDYGACIIICNKMLNADPCIEYAHRLLMRCYSQQGQYHFALRLYHQCLSILEQELEVLPSPKTTQLFEAIRHHNPV